MNTNSSRTNSIDEKEMKGTLKTESGTIHWQWDSEAPLTLHGFLPFFSQYLSTSGIFDAWINECPLTYTSNNAPAKKDVLGTAFLSVLAGHTRYAHASSLYGDTVASELLGMNKTVSHDSLMRGIAKLDEQEALEWQQNHLFKCCAPLLNEPYVLDIDPTVKPIYGHQEGAEIGYNPKKPGRPSHCYHAYMIGTLRLILDVEVHPGNKTAGKYSHPGLWHILDTYPRHLRPTFIRGDIGYGTEGTMCGCEKREVRYLFKVKRTTKIKRIIKELEKNGMSALTDAGDGWKGCETEVLLSGWTKKRRVIILCRPSRKKINEQKVMSEKTDDENVLFPVVVDEKPENEYQILITNLAYPIMTIAQLYRERSDCENAFDELKNQWGWGGFTTKDIKRTRIMAQLTALTYNWWNIFCRLAEPNTHIEGKTGRRFLQNIIGKMVNTGGQRIMRLASTGSDAVKAIELFKKICAFLNTLNSNATQLEKDAKWALILSYAFRKYLDNQPLKTIFCNKQMLIPI
jgi:hypothetical protein